MDELQKSQTESKDGQDSTWIWSPTRLQTWLNDKSEFYKRYILKEFSPPNVGMLQGRLFDQLIKDYLKGKEKVPNALLDNYLYWIKNEKVDWTGAQFDVKIEKEIEGIKCVGILDALLGDVILDWKTSTKNTVPKGYRIRYPDLKSNREGGGKWDLQIGFYMMLTSIKKGTIHFVNDKFVAIYDYEDQGLSEVVKETLIKADREFKQQIDMGLLR